MVPVHDDLVVIGGKVTPTKVTKKLFKLTCQTADDCEIKKMKQQLKRQRDYLVAMAIPEEEDTKHLSKCTSK